MDTNQLDDEQLYYKEKYLKYKLKYVALKQRGGRTGVSARRHSKSVDNLMETILGKQEYSKAIANLIDKYFEAKCKSDELYTKLINKQIFNQIYNVSSFNASTLSTSIDYVLKHQFLTNSDAEKTELKDYLWKIIHKFYKMKKVFDMFNLKKAKENLTIYLGNETTFIKYASNSQDNDKIERYTKNINLYNILKENNIFDEIEKELSTNKYLVHENMNSVIDAVLNKQIKDDNNRSILKSFLVSNFLIGMGFDRDMFL